MQRTSDNSRYFAARRKLKLTINVKKHSYSIKIEYKNSPRWKTRIADDKNGVLEVTDCHLHSGSEKHPQNTTLRWTEA